jgi:hypothetical protein
VPRHDERSFLAFETKLFTKAARVGVDKLFLLLLAPALIGFRHPKLGF